MFDKINRYIKFYRKADTIHNIHSPFVYDFINNVLDTSKLYYAFNALEHERKILISNRNTIELKDFGAGSKTFINNRVRSISSIAKNVVSNVRKCRILFNLINTNCPQYTIELGTSLGIATMYMAKASMHNTIYTIEADPNVYKLAHVLFERNNVPNVHVINDTFDKALPLLLDELPHIDIAYIDGNHQYAATMQYFSMIRSKCHKGSVIVMDDINWSEDMARAWEEIKAAKHVAYTIDIFDMGFVFFDNSIGAKEDFKIIDFWKKPYRLGIFG